MAQGSIPQQVGEHPHSAERRDGCYANSPPPPAVEMNPVPSCCLTSLHPHSPTSLPKFPSEGPLQGPQDLLNFKPRPSSYLPDSCPRCPSLWPHDHLLVALFRWFQLIELVSTLPWPLCLFLFWNVLETLFQIQAVQSG